MNFYKNRFKFLFILCAGLSCISIRVMAGTIFFLNGTSSAGKSSITRILPALLKEPTEIVDIDAVALELLQITLQNRNYKFNQSLDIFSLIESTPESILSKQDIINLYPTAQKKAYELVRKFFLEGKNVITETVVFGAYDTRQCMQALHDLPVMFIFVYCSPTILLKHILARNQSGDEAESRDILASFFMFLEVCKKHKEGDYCIDSMNIIEINSLFDSIHSSLDGSHTNETISLQVNALRDNFLHIFELDKFDNAMVAPMLQYDCVINTNLSTPKDCAAEIVLNASSSRKNAIEKNYIIVKDKLALPNEKSSLELAGNVIWDFAKGRKNAK